MNKDKHDEETKQVIDELCNSLNEQQRIALERDDNKEILNMVVKRMGIGAERYGHGLRAFDDTRQWGTDVDSWAEMALEEVLDMVVYLAMEIIRIERHRNGVKSSRGEQPTECTCEPTERVYSPSKEDNK